MEEDLFTNLPTEIMIDILSKLPIPTVMSCKCVCKAWHDLMKSRDFANSYLAKSVPLLVYQELHNNTCKILEFIDEEVNPCWNISFSAFPHTVIVRSSVDGLLFLSQLGGCRCLYICNPITREYIKLPHPPDYSGISGFGVSRITRQYKIICVTYDTLASPEYAYIYTLGTGCWRSIIIPSDDDRLQFYTYTGVFLNGNLHWLVVSDDLNGTTLRIHCMDLETELFSTFSILNIVYCYADKGLTVLGDQLCFLGSEFVAGEINIDIWLMKEYRDEKSWTREFVIKECYPLTLCCSYLYNLPIRFCKNDDLLLAVGYGGQVGCFSFKTNTIRKFYLPGLHANSSIHAVTYTLSFLPQLKSFAKENVCSF